MTDQVKPMVVTTRALHTDRWSLPVLRMTFPRTSRRSLRLSSIWTPKWCAELVQFGVSATDILHQRQAAFKVGDEVTMKVSKRVMIDGEEKTRVSIDAFTIAGRHCHLSHWQYKLEDGKGLPYDSGNWVPEGKLDAI